MELLGNGFLYSVNFERYFGENISVRVGGMTFSGTGTAEDGSTARAGIAIFPVLANYLIGSDSHKLEFGAGPLFLYASIQSDELGNISGFGVGATARLGYVYLPADEGFNFRLVYNPAHDRRLFSFLWHRDRICLLERKDSMRLPCVMESCYNYLINRRHAYGSLIWKSVAESAGREALWIFPAPVLAAPKR